jgi:DNA-binding response OmpR family regulator
LVIEDEESILELIRDILILEGFDVITATNGKDGLEAAIFALPNLILCDVTMPEINGYQVLEELQKNFFTQTIPFIFLTARTSRENIRAGMNLGADDYMTKPFSMEELLARIQAVLRRSQKVAGTEEVKPATSFVIGAYIFDYEKQVLHHSDIHQKLTSKESELLKLLFVKYNSLTCS